MAETAGRSDAHATVQPTGSFHWSNPGVGAEMDGSVTCLVIRGSDAWIAGPLNKPNLFDDTWGLRVHDGGRPGTNGEMAVTFAGDARILRDCESAREQWGRCMELVVEGNLVIHD